MTLGRFTGGRVRIEHIWTCLTCQSQFVSIDKTRGKRPVKYCSASCHSTAMKQKLQLRHQLGLAHKFDKACSIKGNQARDANPTKMIEANRRISKAKIGVKNPPGPSAASPDHWKALYWKIRSPNRIVLQGWNLNDLIRKNTHMFNPEDIKWKQHGCRASRGIANLFLTRKKRDGTRVFCANSWKDWMPIDRLPLCN